MSVTTEMKELLETGRARGPLSKVLNKYWNGLHDLEYDLEQVMQEYDGAASLPSTGTRLRSERDAKNMMKAISSTIKAVKALADSGGAFDKLLSAESDFINKHGPPEAYRSKTQHDFGFR